MLHYDNLEDVKGKLLQTFCYYKGKAVLVKDVQEPEAGKFIICVVTAGGRQKYYTTLDDPDFNFMRFNIGYTNHTHSSVWWCRVPNRQYRQGLRADQLRPTASSEHFLHRVEFNFNSPAINMLENIYPHFQEIEKPLKDRTSEILAFHKDFAATWDRVHQDLIVEYKGKPIGCVVKNDLKLMEEYTHLTEALKEAMA